MDINEPAYKHVCKSKQLWHEPQVPKNKLQDPRLPCTSTSASKVYCVQFDNDEHGASINEYTWVVTKYLWKMIC